MGLGQHAGTALTAAMTTAEATRAELALSELHEHLAAIERLARAPFNAERIAKHKELARECLDSIALELDA